MKVALMTIDNLMLLPEYKIHPDNAELDDEPILFEEMMNANVEEDGDSDEEDLGDDDSEEEEEEEVIREMSATEGKKEDLGKARNKTG